MRLADYMEKHGLSDDDLAGPFKVTRATVSRLRRGKMVPSFDLVVRIHEATGKKVTPNDFLDVAASAPDPERAAS